MKTKTLSAVLICSTLALGFARATFAETWDLTKGVPEGFTPRTNTRMTPQGLTTNGLATTVDAGIRAKTKFTYPAAFCFEAEVSLKPGENGGIVWDDIYSPDDKSTGFRLSFSKGWQSLVYPRVILGFNGKSVQLNGPALTTNEAEHATIGVTYTANRTLYWDVNGKKHRCRVERAGALGTGKHPITIGDRVGSRHDPFRGTVKRVSITPVDRMSAALEVEVGRKAFLRCEEGATLPFWVASYADAPLKDAQVTVRQFADDILVKTTALPLPALKYDEKTTLAAPVETRLRPGKLRFEFDLTAAGVALKNLHVCEGAIAKRVGERMEIVLGDSYGYYDEFGKIGATKGMAAKFMRFTGYERGLKPTEEERIVAYKEFDDALKAGMTLGISQPFMYPDVKDKTQFYRKNRDGTTRRDNVYKGPYPEVGQPALQEFTRSEAKFFCDEFGSHPAFKGVISCSEVRDASFPSFNTEHLRYRAETGRDVPQKTPEEAKLGERKWAAARFADGIVPEDDPFYLYRMWWHGGGDGWPAFLSAAYDEYRKTLKDPEFRSIWDPAARCHPIWSSGGTADMLGNWVYAVPEPMAVAGPTDEVLAMARGKGQKVQAQTQIICYRRSVAPAKEQPDPEPKWFKTHPKAAFVTIPPDALKEATWSMIAKPVDEVEYYSFECIIETGTDWYACTAPEAKDVLRDLCWNVLRPLGPTLKRLGRRRPRVALFESYTSTFFGSHYEYGWQSSTYMHAQRARLDPGVVFEQEILRDGLDGIDVLYAPHVPYVTRKIKDAIEKFQKRGGILVCDNAHCKALKPDVIATDATVWIAPKIDQPEGIEELEATKGGNKNARFATARAKNVKIKNAEIFKQRLAEKGFVPEVDTSSAEIIPYLRHHGDIPYVFAVNDKRTFGDYVGQWGHMMEKGLPFEGEVTIRDPGFKNLAVYELSRGGLAAFTRQDGIVHVPVKYATTDGRLFVFAEEKIGELKLKVEVEERKEKNHSSTSTQNFDSLKVELQVLGESGRRMKDLWPVEVRVKDAAGHAIDGMDYGCAVDGVFTGSVPLNLNDAKGAYTVTVRDRASGLEKTAEVCP